METDKWGYAKRDKRIMRIFHHIVNRCRNPKTDKYRYYGGRGIKCYLTVDEPVYIHIDWDRTARDIMMDYAEENGHYFRNL